jgi:hypothetical protein
MGDRELNEFLDVLSRNITKSVLGTDEGPLAAQIAREFYARADNRRLEIKQLLEEYLLMNKGDPTDQILKLIIE